MRARPIPLTFLAAAVALLLSTSAHAAGWVTGPALSPSARVALTPMAAFTASGERIVAWEQLGADGATPESIDVRVAPAHGNFGASQAIPVGEAFDPSLTVGTDGTAALVWLEDEQGGAVELHIARRAPGQTSFTQAQPFALGGREQSSPAVAVAGGEVFVAIATFVQQTPMITTAIRAVGLAPGAQMPAALDQPVGSLDSVTYNSQLSDSVRVDDPSIAVSNGVLYVAWDHLFNDAANSAASTTIVRAASRPIASGSFSDPENLDTLTRQSFFADAATPQLAGGPHGVVAVWIREDAEQLAFTSLSAPASTPETIAAGGFPGNLHVAFDGRGSMLLAWEDFLTLDEQVTGVMADVVPAGGRAGTPTRLTARNANRELDAFAVAADGNAVVIINRSTEESFQDSAEQVEASFRAPGGGFGALEEVSGPQDRTGAATFDRAALALGPKGEAFVAWSADDRSSTPNERVFVSQRDDQSPTIASVDVPKRAHIGASVSMSVNATDALSPVTVQWDFGDGASAQGAHVSHFFGAPGSYRVTATARDGAGNVSSRSAIVKVSATAPVISALKLTHRRFSVSGGGTALIAAAEGTTFLLHVNERATIVISLKRARTGSADTIVRAGRGPGLVSIPFSGRIGHTPLSPGTYRASVSAIGPFGTRSRTSAVTFTVVGR